MGKKGKNPAATKAETILDAGAEEGRVLTLLEVDPATEDPAVLDAIRYLPSHSPRQSCDPTVVTHSRAHSSCYYADGDGERLRLVFGWLAFW
jgi:hypothetical protein